GVPRVVRVDHGAEEFEHLLRHVGNGGGTWARQVDLRMPARLRNGGVPSEGAISRAFRHQGGHFRRYLGFLEERHGPLPPQELKGAFPLGPGASPKFDVREVYFIKGEHWLRSHTCHPSQAP